MSAIITIGRAQTFKCIPLYLSLIQNEKKNLQK